MKRIVILGATGSIGRQTLDIVRAFPEEFEVIGLAAGANVELLAEQMQEFHPRHICCTNSLPSLPPDVTFTAMAERVCLDEVDLVMVATIGSVGLIPTLNAEENILLPLSIAREDVERDWFHEIVKTLGISDRLSHLPSQLSGGQQQRVAVARALISRPIIVCADEPTGNLDSRASDELLGFIREAVDEIGQTVVMVTHDPLVAAYADGVVFLQDGKIIDEMADPNAEAIFDHLKSLGD